MAHATVSCLSLAAHTELNRASVLHKQNGFANPLVLSVPRLGRYYSYPSILATRPTGAATTTTGEHRAIITSEVTAESGKSKPKAVKIRSPTRLTLVTAVITIVKKQRRSREEQMIEVADVLSDKIGNKIFLQLISAEIDAVSGIGKRSKDTFIKDWVDNATVEADKVQYSAEFVIDTGFGEPGAILIRNTHQSEIYLESIALLIPSATIYFPCHSYVAASSYDPKPRVFFCNKVYMPWETPPGLKDLREQELKTLQGNGKGKRKSWERIYDYDVYHDLGDPDKSPELERSVLGGEKFPYPRRVRSGRDPCQSDPTKEEKVANGEAVYVPRDESFEPIKQTNFIVSKLRGLVHKLVPSVRGLLDATPGEFDDFRDIEQLYLDGLDVRSRLREKATKAFVISDIVKGFGADQERNRFIDGLPIPDYYKALIQSDSTPTSLLKYPLPKILSKDRFAWIRDDEFARQTLAGVNPVVISCLEDFPPRSKLNPEKYGSQKSAIKPEHIESKLEGLTLAEAVNSKRLFVVDYHDILMPYVERINALEGRKIYASRSVFFLDHNGVLKPVVIELSLPPSDPGAIVKKRVFTPGTDGTSFWLWQLAKLHVGTNDSGHHQLISHWLRSHACTEPYIIATYRKLSALHPIAKLLHPHLRYTIEINAAARQNLINAGGVIEDTFTPGKYALEISAAAYDLFWRFDKEALPEDLIRRGMAVRDENAPHGLRLRIEDYPFATDGLLVWSTIKEWVHEYVALYYTSSQIILKDDELQQWWKEIQTKGHADKKDEPWWPRLETPEDLVKILTTLVWVVSGHHAAVNFGQYDYAGFVPNRPCLARRLIPEPTDLEFQKLLQDPHQFMLETLPSQEQATVLMMIVESLSTHSPDEEYLGHNGFHTKWTSDERAIDAFKRFSARLAQVDKQIHERNGDLKLKHQAGAGTLPYELLLHKSGPGITMRGVPNSVSI